MSYDEKFRRHVLTIKEQEGLSLTKVAKRFGIGKQTVYNWTKCIEEKKKRDRLPQKISLEELATDIANAPDAYQHERAKRFGVSTNCIWRALQRLGVSYKKKVSSIRRQIPSKDLYSAKSLKNMALRNVLLSLLMNRDSPMICPEPMGMPSKGSVVMAPTIGVLKEEPM